MFLRRCQRRKDGKVHTYWALVESHRTAKGSRQRVVAYLGELKSSERAGWAELGRRLDRNHHGRACFEEIDCRIGALRRLVGIKPEVVQCAPANRVRVLVLRKGL